MQLMKILIVALFSALPLGSAADVPIEKLTLGRSLEDFQQILISESMMFSKVTSTQIEAKKYASIYELDQEQVPYISYTSLNPSTTVTAKLCNGKVYSVVFTSIFRQSQTDLLAARKEIFKYLTDNNAVLDRINLNQNESSREVGERFIIDRNSIPGQVKGEETLTFSIDEVFPNGPLELKYMIENKWFCPQ